jgi:hypothetical protein
VATKQKYATDAELAENLAHKVQNLPDNWLMCRDVRHAWDVTEDFHVTKHKASKVQEIRRVLVCLRCKCERHERYAVTKWGLDKVGQTYKHPDGYVIHGVPRGVKPSFIIQGEQYRRVMEKLAEAQQVAPKKGAPKSPTLTAV